jgi:hypothetical protein
VATLGPRSQCLVRVNTGAAPGNGVFNCPESHVTLVKSVIFGNSGAAPVVCAVQIRTWNSSVITEIYRQTIQPGTGGTWSGWFALNPTDMLFCSMNGPNVSCWASGAVLQGEPLVPPGRFVMRDDIVVPLPAPTAAQPGLYSY